MQNIITTKIEEEHLKKRIMRRVYLRWFLTKKLPYLLVEFSVITFLVLMAQTRVSLLAIAKNAYLVAADQPLSLVWFSFNTFSATRPGIQLLTILIAVLAVMIVRDVRLARRYNPLLME